MRNLCLLVCCLLLGGCSRGPLSILPIASGGGESFVRQASPSTPTFKSLYSFTGGLDGRYPVAALLNVNGMLYGTTRLGGERHGTIFNITTSGAVTVLHRFRGGSDGSEPRAALIEVNGALYGTTINTLFKLTLTGGETVLHVFNGGSDGYYADAPLTYLDGMLYGTTDYGNGTGCRGNSGCGTVFESTPSGAERVLHGFGTGTDGTLPLARLIEVDGAFYGTTQTGGGTSCLGGSGCGTVFTLTQSGTESVIYRFAGGSDGQEPEEGLVDVGGVLYGTTYQGGAAGSGTVFKITPSGTESVIYSFLGGSDGANPLGGLTYVGGALYGCTRAGGASGQGTVFEITPSGTESVLYSFTGGSDGANPEAGVIDLNGTLYGTTNYGGSSGRGYGTVFALTL